MSDHIKLSKPLEHLVAGLMTGSGTISRPSLLTIDGVRPDLRPIVVAFSPVDGLRRFLTVLATFTLLKQDTSGAHILTLSWALEREALRSLVESSPGDGDSDEIEFEVLIDSEAQNSTSQNTSLSPLIAGISGARCDLCSLPFVPTDEYVQVVNPPVDRMSLYHGNCVRVEERV